MKKIISVSLFSLLLIYTGCKKRLFAVKIEGTVLHAYTNNPISNADIIYQEADASGHGNSNPTYEEKGKSSLNDDGTFTMKIKGLYKDSYVKRKNLYVVSNTIVQDKESGKKYPLKPSLEINLNGSKNQTIYVYPLAWVSFNVDSTTSKLNDIKEVTITTNYVSENLSKGFTCDCPYWYSKTYYVEPGVNTITYKYVKNDGTVSSTYTITPSFVAGNNSVDLTF